MKKIILLILLVFLVGCQQDPIKIGLVATLSGLHSDVGISTRNGLLYRVEELNNQGGIKGRKIEVIIKDDNGDSELTKQLSLDLIDEGVDALFGFELSKKVDVVKSLLDQDIVIMSPTLSTYEMSGLDDQFYRTINSNYEQGLALAEATKEFDDVVIIYSNRNREFSEGVIEGYKDVYKNPIKTLALDDYVIYYEDEILESIEGADALVIILNSYDTLTLGQFLYKNSKDLVVYSSNWGISGDDYLNAGKALDGVFFITFLDKRNGDKYDDFSANYQDKFLILPPMVAIYSYEAATVLFEAFTEQDNQDLKTAIDALDTIEGVISDLKFNPNGDLIREIHITVFEDGQLHYID